MAKIKPVVAFRAGRSDSSGSVNQIKPRRRLNVTVFGFLALTILLPISVAVIAPASRDLRVPKALLSFVRRLVRDQHGVTVVEYALIVCLISIVAVISMTTLGRMLFSPAGPIGTALN